ncbi:Glutamate [NMDA] receptor subunit epsilon-2, partial [Fasciolopsis buskii]
KLLTFIACPAYYLKFLFVVNLRHEQLQQPWNVKPPFRFATIPSGATEENIKINFPEMSAYMRKFNRSTVEEGLKALRSGLVELNAFIYDAHVLNYWVSRDEGCKLRIVGNLYAMTGYGIGFTKGHKWVEKINSRILDYQKNGRFNFDIINL